MAQPAWVRLASTIDAALPSSSAPSTMSTQMARGRSSVGKAPPSPRTMSKAPQRGRGGADGLDGRHDLLLGRRAEEAQGQVQPIHPDPAHVATAAVDPERPDVVDETGQRGGRFGRQGHGDEQAAARHVLARPGPLARPTHRGTAAPVSRSQVWRSERRTSSARSCSRQPSISTVLSSSAL